MPDERLPLRRQVLSPDLRETVLVADLAKAPHQIISGLLQDDETGPWQTRTIVAYEVLRPLMDFYPASRRWHHTGVGGLAIHIAQVARLLRWVCEGLGIESCTSRLIALALLHDAGKFTKYMMSEKGTWANAPNPSPVSEDMRIGLLVNHFGMPADDEFLNALTFSHGGWANILRDDPDAEMLPLAVALHSADLISSRVVSERGYFRVGEAEARRLMVEEGRLWESLRGGPFTNERT